MNNFVNHTANKKHTRFVLPFAFLLILIVGITFPYAREAGTTVQPFLPAFISAVAI
ncbi:hypothetical protein [Paenibacillus sp. N3.4]|uniref:hypothetical protein n=1 Tax=Paenibacillus sp. N3.4 TaxID=2603222 RepID=UPI001C9CA55F|nr:hypothetical protein [Paenibacillus sp. N3.4]